MNNFFTQLSSFFTTNFMDAVTFTLSLIGSIGTFVSLIHAWYHRREKIDVILSGKQANDHGMYLYLQFINSSTANISITRISGKIDNTSYIAVQIPQVVLTARRKSGSTITSSTDFYSMQFPINLAPSEGTAGYILFLDPSDTFPHHATEITIEIVTGRKKILKSKLNLEQSQTIVQST